MCTIDILAKLIGQSSSITVTDFELAVWQLYSALLAVFSSPIPILYTLIAMVCALSLLTMRDCGIQSHHTYPEYTTYIQIKLEVGLGDMRVQKMSKLGCI